MSGLLPPLTSIPSDVVCAADYEHRAREHMAPDRWAYLSGGASDEITLADNTSAFAALKLMPRVLSAAGPLRTEVNVAGLTLPHPFLLAPIGWQALFHPHAEIAVAQAASVTETPFAVSTYATTPVETIAAHCAAPLFFQIYFQPSRDTTLQLVRKAEAAGCKALLVTVDAPVSGIRNREQRAGYALPAGMVAANLPPSPPSSGAPVTLHARPGWKDLEWLAAQTGLPVFVKGVLAPDDALRSLDCGASGIVVSNHGGRVLDTAPAAIAALPAVAAAVNGKAPVLLDSGIRRGADAFKAIALGAQAVFVGRPYIWALSVAGALGVAHLMRTLREEFEITLALMGCQSPAEIAPEHLFRAL